MSKQFTVVMDAGHGAHDSGAVNGLTGVREKDIVLVDSLKIGKLLELAGMTVIQTRHDDSFHSLSKRAAIANEYDAPLISLHCNASNTQGKGFEAFTSPGNTQSDELATMMLESYKDEVASKYGLAARYDLRDGDPDKEARFTVLTKTRNVAVLFELGFIDNAHDEDFLTNEKASDHRCAVLAGAIIDWAVKYRGFVLQSNEATKMVAKSPATAATAGLTALQSSARIKSLEGQLKALQVENKSANQKIIAARKALG